MPTDERRCAHMDRGGAHLLLEIDGGAGDKCEGAVVDDDASTVLLEHGILRLELAVSLLQLEFVGEP